MPISDATREEAAQLAKRYPVARSALLPMLHLVQSDEGYVSEDGIALCATTLGLTKAEVGAVATFYTMYKREPFGDYLLSVCTNPTCKIAGAQDIYESYVEACGDAHVDTDGAGVMVEHAECLGICDAAPVVQINYEMYGPVTHDEAMDLLAKAKAGDPPASNRSGEVPPTIRDVHREFSGIDDAFGDHLVAAAALQATSAVPPSYRTGETDIPVTHPGGDPAGHGGVAFRAAAGFDGESVSATRDADADDLVAEATVAPETTPAADEKLAEVARDGGTAGTEQQLAEDLTDEATAEAAPAVEDQPELDAPADAPDRSTATPPEAEQAPDHDAGDDADGVDEEA
ncbi:MAG: NAD(P)H-dependent oxidoreductase subunit E [Nitriliruptoraceae bacterium]|nr:NAD(P)H-dependent oxidoreductase subunit E [Nitriliruptoraceae bacterium]